MLTLAFYRPARRPEEDRHHADPDLRLRYGDTVAPIGPTARGAAGCDNITLNRYPYGHFEIYVGDAFERASADQLSRSWRGSCARSGGQFDELTESH